MASKPIELLMKVKADSSQVPAGLKGMTDGLEKVKTGAEQTETAVKNVGKTPVSLTIRDEAIAKSRARIKQLQDQIAQAKTLDINADTKDAEREIAKLRGGIRTLEGKSVDIPIGANAGPATQSLGRFGALLDGLKGKAAGLQDVLGGLGGGGGLGNVMSLFSGGGGLAAGIGAAALAAGKLEMSLGQMAANAETARVAWKGILQSADEAATVVKSLRDFSATTPFDFETVDRAAKGLVAYGVATEDLQATLTNLGNAAAAVNAPLDQVARAYGQMVGKGKITGEEMLQLTEAGLPGWRLLADAMGLTVEQVQELSQQGKLGADAVKLLGDALGTTFKGSMSDQAKTFNGVMSNLGDSFTQTGQNVGQLFLPTMKNLAVIMAEVADLTSKASAVFTFFGENVVGQAIASQAALGPIGAVVKVLADGIGLLSSNSEDAALSQEALAAEGAAVKASLTDSSKAMDNFNKVVAEGVKDHLSALNTELQNATTKLDAFFGALGQGGADQDAYTRSLISLTESVKENGKKFDDNSVAALNNRDALREVAAKASALIQPMVDAGASTDDIKRKTQNLRDEFITAAGKMGIQGKAAEDLANKYGLVPDKVATEVSASGVASTKAQIEDVQRQADALNGSVAVVNVHVNYDAKYAAMDRAQAQSLGAQVGPSGYGVPPSPEVARYGARMSPMATAAPMAAAAPSRTYTINVNVERGTPSAEVGRQIVDSIRAFERAAGRSWRASS